MNALFDFTKDVNTMGSAQYFLTAGPSGRGGSCELDGIGLQSCRLSPFEFLATGLYPYHILIESHLNFLFREQKLSISLAVSGCCRPRCGPVVAETCWTFRNLSVVKSRPTLHINDILQLGWATTNTESLHHLHDCVPIWTNAGYC